MLLAGKWLQVGGQLFTNGCFITTGYAEAPCRIPGSPRSRILHSSFGEVAWRGPNDTNNIQEMSALFLLGEFHFKNGAMGICRKRERRWWEHLGPQTNQAASQNQENQGFYRSANLGKKNTFLWCPCGLNSCRKHKNNRRQLPRNSVFKAELNGELLCEDSPCLCVTMTLLFVSPRQGPVKSLALPCEALECSCYNYPLTGCCCCRKGSCPIVRPDSVTLLMLGRYKCPGDWLLDKQMISLFEVKC